jgi:DNA polymerase III subunit epsilon
MLHVSRSLERDRLRAVFCFAVPDLTRNPGIQLNERVSLRRSLELLTSSQSCGLGLTLALPHQGHAATRAIRGRRFARRRRPRPSRPIHLLSCVRPCAPALVAGHCPRGWWGFGVAGVTDFIALDVETANADFGSICAIGLVHFRAGAVFKSLTILVDPEDEFDPTNIGIHGIRPEHVAGKPTMAKVFPVISAALQDAAIVHHSPFDRTALARAAGRYGTGGLPCIWLDSCQVARETWDRFREDGGYGLANLARAFDIRFSHHEAAEDARAAGLLLLRALSDGGTTLQEWIDNLGYESTVDTAPRRIRAPVYARKVAQQGSSTGPLAGETIVFTGALQIGRAEAASEAAAAGCNVADSVTKKTTILVVGDQDLWLTRGQEKSSKHRKAEGMIAGGSAIRIVGESDFILMVR